jgi:hypothetical protein
MGSRAASAALFHLNFLENQYVAWHIEEFARYCKAVLGIL